MARETDMTGTTLSSTVAGGQTVPPIARPGGRSDGSQLAELSPPEDQPSRRWITEDSKIPACLISTLVHTLLLIILALFTYGRPGGTAGSLQARQGDPSQTVTLQAIESKQDARQSERATMPQSVTVNVAPAPANLSSPLRSASVQQQSDAGLLAAIGGGSANPAQSIRLPVGGMSGRTPEGRAEFGRRFGATPQSERAVEEALRWIAEHQRHDGSWSFDLELSPCNGRCRHSKVENSVTPTTAATGLAILAFLGAGYTHQEGPYQETVRRGLYYLRDTAAEAEAGYDLQKGSMYGHGIALMAIAEAMVMTSEDDAERSELFDLTSRSAWFTVIAQHDSGSWGYVPGSPGDTTLTGWQVLSLLAAKRGGAPMGTYTFRDAKEFLLSTTDGDYSFGYKGPPGEPTTTAIGLTLMLYLGESPDYTPFYDALTALAERGPTLTNVYHDYYGTLALHHSRHRDWDRWNTELRDFLVAKQATSGHERGSWHFKDRWGDVGGRLYTTAMCTMMLEVYYRYLPLYDEIEEFPL